MKLQKGQRVRMSRKGQDHLVRRWTQRGKPSIMAGVFLGLHAGCYLRVLRDLHKQPDIYHPDFWEAMP